MSVIDFSKADCKNCYKCVNSCSVKAIKMQNNQANIVEERCISCGHCLVVCPQNARSIKSDLENVKAAIKAGKKVAASLAPSFPGFFQEYSPYRLVSALKKIGFSIVEETSIGAEVVSDLYENCVKEDKYENFITTSCPSVNYLIEKYYPSLIKYMAPVVSPMTAHGKLLKEKYGDDCYTVFIGPCISKKAEAEENNDSIDAVLTFEELFEWTDGENIDFGNLEDQYFDRVSTVGASGYPLIGGVLNSMDKKNIDFEFIEVDGTPECMEIFKSIEKGDITGVCIEANVCKGGCIGGPYSAKDKKGLYNRQISVKNYIRSKKKIDNIEKIEIPKNLNFSRFYRDKTFQHKYASDYEIEIILKKMGKYEKKDELNCGGCGYNTCREKAEAVFEGMSEAEHCLPFLRSKAEGFKDIIFENSPNIIMVLDENLKVKEFNPTSEKTFNIRAFDIKTKYINELFDDKDFRKVKETGNSIINHKVSISKYNLVVIENIVYVPKEEIFISIMTNISDDEKNKKELSKVKQETINAAQEVIDNQMRVAQEIASLLGETTADTKVILTKLKKLALQEQGELK